MSSQLENNHVIFRNYSSKKYWEISGPMYTTYMMYDIIGYEYLDTMMLMMFMHGIPDTVAVCKTLIEYTQNPQEDMFLVEI